MLHDDFLTLFPQYWASVPMGFEYVVVGQIPRHFDTGNYTVEGAAANLALVLCIVMPMTGAINCQIPHSAGDRNAGDLLVLSNLISTCVRYLMLLRVMRVGNDDILKTSLLARIGAAADLLAFSSLGLGLCTVLMLPM